MLRILLTIVLPIAIPLVAYFAYAAYARRRALLAGEDNLPHWREGPWFWVLLGGTGLMIATLVALGLTSGVPPGAKLEPPRLIDGKVVPSHVVE